ncbi:SAM domain-containing protein (plasmid) [Sinorhizobium meliloti]|nr:SAM domain-containing protein [Sinorhizobium meliloti]
MDIGAWLRDQGLGQYEGTFRQNDIDPEVLRHLTAEDLIGGRRRFSRAPS